MRPKYTLQEVCSIKITDGTHQTPTYCEEKEGVPFISSKDVTKEYIDRKGGIKYIPQILHEELYKRIAPQKDDVLLAKNGTTGVAAIVEDDRIFDIYVTLAVLRPNQKIITPRFLHRIVNSPICKRQFDKSLKGAGVPNLHLENIKKVEIPLPPLETQKAIVAKLDQIFAELDQTKSEIQKNLDNTDELWKSALNQAFQGDWEMKKLGEVCDFVRGPFGGSLKKEIFVKEGYAVYEQQHAIYNQFSDFRYFVNEEKFLEMKRFEVYPGDLIMSCSGTMGKVSIVPKNSPKGIINQALLKITPSKLINAEFLKNWMDSKDFQDQIGANTQGAAIQNVASVKVISTLNIPVPPLSEQEKIVEYLDQVSKEVKELKSQYQSQLDNLEELKKSVLDKAFRGEMGE